MTKVRSGLFQSGPIISDYRKDELSLFIKLVYL